MEGLRSQSFSSSSGLRPVNLRSDLAPLADLMGLVFGATMDSNDQAAIQEMRYLSKIGIGSSLLTRMNDLALGISLGFVWMEDNRLVGNVSIYPAHWPRELGSTWSIANVGVHPDYRRRGIARQLMLAAMEMIRQRGGRRAVLQVDADNEGARKLYLELGFIGERNWTVWRQNSGGAVPSFQGKAIHITRPAANEWRAELALAEALRPAEKGGLGWNKPLHESLFRVPWWRKMLHWLSMSEVEKLIIRSEDRQRILASIWIDRGGLASSTTRLTLMTAPEVQGLYDDALLNTVMRRFRTTTFSIEHPADEVVTNEILRRYRFQPRRTSTHMRWEA